MYITSKKSSRKLKRNKSARNRAARKAKNLGRRARVGR